ncbi:hypothetical protein ES703_62928 [subsurface metagenome]
MAVHRMKLDDREIKVIADALREKADKAPNDKYLAFLARRFKLWGTRLGKRKRPFYSRISVTR